MLLDCVTWTIRNNYGGRGDIASAATTLENCRTECSNKGSCTGIDWAAGQPTGRQCRLVGPWTRQSGRRRGIQRHTIDRTCGQQWLYTFDEIEYCVTFSLPCRWPRVIK